MRIGELAKAANCRAETVRYYESIGLLPPPARNGGNYRVYTAAHANRLAFIRNCRALDMTLDEIRQLLELRDHPARACDAVNELIDAHIAHVSTRIAGLQALKTHLLELRHSCAETSRIEHCQILQQLDAGDCLPEQPDESHIEPSH